MAGLHVPPSLACNLDFLRCHVSMQLQTRGHSRPLLSAQKRSPCRMASNDEHPGATMPVGDAPTAGQSLTAEWQHADKGTQMLQPLKPVKQMRQHVCTFAIYSHDMNRQMPTHHYIPRGNQDFLQAAVYDSYKPNARLIGLELIVSDELFEGLPPEEQKLWHSHAYGTKAGLWVKKIQMPELPNLAKSYGKFWCTWQVDRGDRLPLGAPAPMMSPQAMNLGMVRPYLIKNRDDESKKSRIEIEAPEWINPNAGHWKQTGKGFAIDINPGEMNRNGPFPCAWTSPIT